MRRVASVVRRRVCIVPASVWALRALGRLTEWTMRVPLVATAQVRMLAEGVSLAAPAASELPEDLRPKRHLTNAQISRALPDEGRFTLADLRLPRG